ncbi:hypothetical protein FHS15_003143 [Paenibacillus castaneae]|uniref:DUF1097 domain-containing protein n=1 Tax=Paenibacillus castaneae TaxID=474957 RepID=UPI00141BEBA4|nr:DUF1097 domain-containing protein [Paenibacillus castaneae]NIK78005.1 hypothetical protein [Paenibacillus castaneae]
MRLFLAIAVSTGIFSGIWASFSLTFELITFVGFFAWSSFFAAGGKSKGLKMTLVTNFSGVIWGYLMMKMTTLFSSFSGDNLGMGIAVALGAAGMCLQSRWKWLGFIPGAFIGCSTFFATGFNFSGSISGLIFGALFGYISERGVSYLTNWKREKLS